jgi:hypothetical protein
MERRIQTGMNGTEDKSYKGCMIQESTAGDTSVVDH